ncbi:AraC family transcriptional regulator [Nocardioides zeae]|uniref:AraC-like DNA-binding protein n=1 Tax=Nocardioides zeae TaxID=1457234 RepID=A0AAJ1TWN4_9ACTN|nr:AraC family transcriptional regulator [Nocardioides zeae]MDQ1103415.1 AraC-like DNA-binding protein [Nocardioides zeae]
MFSPTVAHDWHFPRSATGIGVLLAWARTNGIDPAPLLVGTGLAPDDLDGAEGEVTADQELAVVRALLRRRPDDPPARLGAAIGSSYHLGSFGVFGFAMLASPTLLHAVELATRYIDLSFTFAIPRAELEGDAATGTVRVHVDGATLPPDVRPLLVARDARAIGTALRELLPDLPLELRLEPADAPRRAVVSFLAAHLARPLPQGNPQTAAACEQLCAELVERRRSRRGLAQQVRVLAAQEVAGGASAGVVARRLGLSERTLRRRLAAEGTSYSELLDEVRSGLAVGLLATDLSLDEVALRLGYAEASSFIHAHRRWTGRTPRQVAQAD